VKSTLDELLTDRRAPVEQAALLIARDAHPDLDVEAELSRLDAMAEPLRSAPGSRTPHAIADRMASYLHGELGFRGNRDDYYDPRNSYLNDVLHRRLGIPITLTVVWIAIGRRIGVPVDGIGFPGHFLAKVGGPDGVFVDCFEGGSVLDDAALRSLAERHLGDTTRLHPALLTPVDATHIALRMLNNLKAAHQRRGDAPRALVAADRLVDLTGLPEHRRDRGLLALTCGSTAAAIEDLSSYVQARPDAADLPSVRSAIERARARGDRNLQ
jgi:regulator of sirC expression with transglutaminase-like and TPR domain